MFYSSITNRGPVVLGYHCETEPNAHIGPYTSIGDNSTVTYTEIENSIVIERAHRECSRHITDNLIGQNIAILSHENNLPKRHGLILADVTTATSTTERTATDTPTPETRYTPNDTEHITTTSQYLPSIRRKATIIDENNTSAGARLKPRLKALATVALWIMGK
jgi:NDP-sugar pyrophosphorylase family protein